LIILIVLFFPEGILGWLRERYPERFGPKKITTDEPVEDSGDAAR